MQSEPIPQALPTPRSTTNSTESNQQELRQLKERVELLERSLKKSPSLLAVKKHPPQILRIAKLLVQHRRVHRRKNLIRNRRTRRVPAVTPPRRQTTSPRRRQASQRTPRAKTPRRRSSRSLRKTTSGRSSWVGMYNLTTSTGQETRHRSPKRRTFLSFVAYA